jgi:hypothetical protein
MAGQLFIEWRPAGIFGFSVGAAHLYVLHRDTDGKEYVIRSGPDSWLPFRTSMDVEVNVPIEHSADARGDQSPASRSSTPLEFPDLDADQAWALMVSYARAVARADYPYVLLEENSNAFIGALLAAAGGVPGDLLPDGVDSDEAVGFSSYDRILKDIAPPADGVVTGSSHADRIHGIQVGEVIKALGGDDRVWAGRGDDLVLGGDGDDSLYGQFGFDVLRGGNGDDRLFAGASGDPARPDSNTDVLADRLYGNGGNDRLKGSRERDLLYGGNGDDQLRGGGGDDRLSGGAGDDLIDGGTGNNLLYGGTGADTFFFTDGAASSNRVRGFEDGVDTIRIQSAVTVDFDDLTLAPSGDHDEHTVIRFDGVRVKLYAIDIELLDAADFEFVADPDLLV